MTLDRDTLAELSDQEIVALAQQGLEAAYRELVGRYERPVFALILRMVRDREMAEDLAQETFIKVLNHIDSYKPEHKFSSWLFKIANNATIDQLRRRRPEILALEGAPDAVSAERQAATALQISGKGENPLEELEARELGGQIEDAIEQLRPDYRACIIMRHVEGRPYEEIAQALDLPLGTVKTYIHRARIQLRELLTDARE